MYIYICIHLHIWDTLDVFRCVDRSLQIYTYIYTKTHIHIYTYTHIYTHCTYTHIFEDMYQHINICIYAYTHSISFATHTHKNTDLWDTLARAGFLVADPLSLSLSLSLSLLLFHTHTHPLSQHTLTKTQTFEILLRERFVLGALSLPSYGVATISRLLKTIGLFCRISSL